MDWAASAAKLGRPELVAETVRMVAERGKGWGYFAAALQGRLNEAATAATEATRPHEDGDAQTDWLERRTRDIARQLQSDDLPLCRRAAEGDRTALSELRRRFFARDEG